MKYAWLLLAISSCFAQSIQSLSTQIQRTPTTALYIDRGLAYTQAGDYRQAIADFNRALEKDAINARALRLRGAAQAKLGRNSDSITDYSSAISLTPADAALYLERASVYVVTGDQRRALEDREEAIRLAPESVDALLARSSSYQQLGREKDALADRDKAIALAPQRADAWLARANGYFAQREFQKAEDDAEMVLTSNASNAEAQVLLAKIHTSLDKVPEPYGTSSVVTPAPVVNVTPAPVKPAEPSRATQPAPVKPAPTADPATAAELYQRGRDLLNSNKLAESIRLLGEAIRLQPGMALAWNARGFAYYMRKDYANAIKNLNEAIRLDPNYLNAIHNRSLARRSAGDSAGYSADRQREQELTKQLDSKQ